jgi:hypothetical protein
VIPALTSARSNAASLPNHIPLMELPTTMSTASIMCAIQAPRILHHGGHELCVSHRTRYRHVPPSDRPSVSRDHQTNGSHGDRFPDRQRSSASILANLAGVTCKSRILAVPRAASRGFRAGQSDTPPTDNDTASTRSASTDFTSTGSPSDARCSVDEFSVISGHLVYAEVPTSVSAVATL